MDTQENTPCDVCEAAQRRQKREGKQFSPPRTKNQAQAKMFYRGPHVGVGAWRCRRPALAPVVVVVAVEVGADAGRARRRRRPVLPPEPGVGPGVDVPEDEI